MHESDSAPDDPEVSPAKPEAPAEPDLRTDPNLADEGDSPAEPSLADRSRAAESALLLFLCPGLSTEELETLAIRRTDPAKGDPPDHAAP